MKLVVSILAGLVVCNAAAAEEDQIDKRTYTSTFANPHRPVIDGRMDDAIWQNTQVGSAFVQSIPTEGAPPTEQTEFKIAHDGENLYVGIRAYDSQPETIAKRGGRRDHADDADLVGVVLDSYFDKRTGFEFTVNAAGVKIDGVWSEDGFNEDYSWDPVWFVQTAVDDSGWCAEMRIPFSQLRFAANAEDQVWGLQVYRKLHRKQERSLWQFIPRDAPGVVHMFGELRGLDNIKTPRRVELLPYSVGKLHRFMPETGNPFATGQNSNLAGGLDGKIGLSSDLTVDFTINPDFGQVEADPSEVNLTAFETFFEEKRPFFIEGKDILSFPLMIGDGDFAEDMLFYSRRIGRSPHHYPDVDDDVPVESPENTTILGAAKLSGKTRTGLSVGVLDALTAEEKAQIQSGGRLTDETVEPFTNYFVSRVKQDFREGASHLGGMFTATNRNLKADHLAFLPRDSYTGGLDFSHSWKDRTYTFELRTSFSDVRGSEEAMLDLQTGSRHYFQRPDAHHLTLDSTRTSLSGHGGYVGLGRFGKGHWKYMVGGMWRSPGLDLNDMGFMRNSDRAMGFIWAQYQELDPFWIFRQVRLNFNQWRGRNFDGENIFAGGNVNGGGQFKNYWWAWSGIGRQGESLSNSALRGGPALRFPGRWMQWFFVQSDERKALQLELSAFNRWNDDGITRSHEVEAEFLWRPANAMTISMDPWCSYRKDNLQYVDTIELNDGDRYVFAHLRQKTLGIVFRLNYSITPNLTIQYYGQPFVSAGQYSSLKKITESRADRYEDRFHTFTPDEIRYDAENAEYGITEAGSAPAEYSLSNPDFNFRQFRSNLVVRWEYDPGSVVYLVWSQGRTGYQGKYSFTFDQDMDSLFHVYPDNVFLIKASRWFSL